MRDCRYVHTYNVLIELELGVYSIHFIGYRFEAFVLARPGFCPSQARRSFYSSCRSVCGCSSGIIQVQFPKIGLPGFVFSRPSLPHIQARSRLSLQPFRQSFFNIIILANIILISIHSSVLHTTAAPSSRTSSSPSPNALNCAKMTRSSTIVPKLPINHGKFVHTYSSSKL